MFDPLREVHDPVMREELDAITDVYVRERVGEQIALIQALGKDHPHSSSLVKEAIPDQPDTFGYTCFQHAFGLTDPPAVVVGIATQYPDLYPSAEFVQFLIDHELTEVTAGEVRDSDVVVYFADGRIKHAGKAAGGFVISKWGTAHLWKHRLFEVPLAYGSQLRFFRAITREDSVFAFIEYGAPSARVDAS